MEFAAFIRVFIHALKPPPCTPRATCQHIGNKADEALHASPVLSGILLHTKRTHARTAKLLPWGPLKQLAEVYV